MPVLTSDNLLLSRLTIGALNVPEGSTINCTTDLPDDVATYIRDSLAPNTRRAYLSDLGEFERWGGSIPASAKTVAAYLAARADTLAVLGMGREGTGAEQAATILLAN